MTNLDRLTDCYKKHLLRLHAEGHYQWPISQADVVVAKFNEAFGRRSMGFAKDGPAVKAACKELGINCTYKAMWAFCDGSPAAAAA